MNKVVGAILAILVLITIYNTNLPFLNNQKVLGASIEPNNNVTIKQYNNSPISTITSFEEKEITEDEVVLYETIYKQDDEMEIGKEEVVEEGIDGKITRTFKVTLWYGEESKRELLDTKVENAINKVIAKGTKIIWGTVSTQGEKNVEEAELSYWRKIENVWATSYDKSCYGCNEWTAVGAKLDYGVCAVDPKVIKLWTQIYVPGYGLCTALDVGGAIKGNKIDVGFYDLHAQSEEVGWRGSHYTDIYLLNNEEANLQLIQ